MDTLTSIKVFRQVVESGSFVGAAERLDLSTAMVSKHVMNAEKRLGLRLLNRNSRTLSLTEPGKVYFERCKIILDDLEATELELGSLNAVPRGTVRVTCPSWFAGQRLADVLVGYRRLYPDVVVDISFEDRFVDLVEEGYDLALRVAHGADSLASGLVARPLRSAAFYFAASRDYLKRNGVPKSPADMSRHDFVAVGNLSSLTLKGPNGTFDVPVRTVMRYRSMSGVANAVAAGIGIAPLPEVYFDDPVFKGVLQPVLSAYPFSEATLYIVYVSRKYVPLKMRTLIDFFVEATGKIPKFKPAAAG